MYDLPSVGRLLTADDFEPWIGKDFVAQATPEPVAIQLLRVNRKLASVFSRRAPFNLVFGSMADVLLIGGTYSLTCGGFGPHELFLTPIVSPPGERLYEAVFN